MFDVKDTDFFEMEDEAFDTIVEDDIFFKGTIKLKKPFLIRGKLEGKIIGKELIFVTSTGSVTGDITTKKVVLEPGCVFAGQCSMVKDDEK